MIGLVLPLGREAKPSSRMHRTGDVDAFTEARALSFPRGESDTPITVIPASTAFSASYACARTRSYVPHARLRPVFENCGCQNRGWLGSFPTPMSLTWGCARDLGHEAD